MPGLDIWDWAPFTPIIHGAGGRVTDWAGRPLVMGSGQRVLAVGDPALHTAGLRLIAAA